MPRREVVSHERADPDGIIRKEVSTGRTLGGEFVISDDSVDRYGDVIEQSGWKLDGFIGNPMALFNHNANAPIGTWTDVRVEGNRTVGRLSLAKAGTSIRIDEIRSLVEQDILRAASVGFRPIKAERIKEKGYRFVESDLLEVSLVSVPALKSALQIAKSMGISRGTMAEVFGEQALDDLAPERRRTIGEQAAATSHRRFTHVTKTLSDRVVDAEARFIEARDTYNAHVAEEEFNIEEAGAYETAMKDAETRLDALRRAEANLAARSEERSATVVSSPAVSLKGRQKDLSGLDLMVRAVVAKGCSHFGSKPIDRVLDERYPGHEATAIIVKADETVGTTTTSGWAVELVHTAYADFLQALTGFSIYPALRDRGIGLSFDGFGTVSIPSRTAGTAGGGFVEESQPIPVGHITTAAATMTAKKMGVIIAFTRELARRSTPAIEALVRQAILEDTAAVLDPLLLDAVALSAARPAGLLNGVASLGAGYGGGDWIAIIEDFKTLLAPFFAANAADNITIIMNPAQALSMSLKPTPDGTFGWTTALTSRLNIIESTHATAGRLIALRNSDFATATGDAPEFDVSEQATVHMSTVPLEIVSGNPTTADPVRSFFQTATIGVRMLMNISWKMRRAGMVQWIDGTSW